MKDQNSPTDFDDESAIPAEEYENLARKFIPGYDGLYALSEVLLADDLPEKSKILVVGAGGGKEITTFGKAFSNSQIIGVDPSEKMLTVAKTLTEKAGLTSRVTLQKGIVSEVIATEFDAATAILVLHFLPDDGEKLVFLQAVYQRLKLAGKFIIADGCFDKNSEDFEWLLRNYKNHAASKGVSAEITEQAAKTVTENVHFVSPERELQLLKEAGFVNIKSFFQGLWVRAWICEKR